MNRTLPQWIKDHELLAFLVLTFVLMYGTTFPTLIAYANNPASQSTGVGTLLEFVGLWSPAISAVLITAVTRGRAGLKDLFSRLLRWRVPIKWYLLIFLGWPAISLLGALLYSLISRQPLTFQWNSWVTFLGWLIQSPLYLFWACEEIGWRGFALPRLLTRWNALVSSVILGVIWTLWHLPFMLGIGGVTLSFPVVIYLILLVSLSILMTWIYNHTHSSVFLMVFFHFWINIYEAFQADKIVFTQPQGEFTVRYLLTAVVAVVVVLLFGWRRLMGGAAVD